MFRKQLQRWPTSKIHNRQRGIAVTASVLCNESNARNTHIDHQQWPKSHVGVGTACIPKQPDPQARPAIPSCRTRRMSSELLLEPNDAGMAQAAELLRTGELLAFPTETVYGLGANALSAEAVLSIFRAKGRPLTDPLIVHVSDVSDADRLIDVPCEVKTVFEAMARQFWPGPLTIITKASQLIPLTVTANTGFVGIRCPKHALARALIAKAGVPVAAPSANRFGHVSPTRAQHVLDDLGDKGVRVLNGESCTFPVETSCEFGIESTVIKLNLDTREVWIYRQGAITQRQLEECLRMNNLTWTVKAVVRTVSMHEQKAEPVTAQVGEEAPGQAVTHYAPDVRCFMVSSVAEDAQVHVDDDRILLEGDQLLLSSSSAKRGAVMIDFGAQFAGLRHAFLAYRDLSSSGDSLAAAQALFDTLRWTEQLEGATVVFIAPIVEAICQSSCSLDDTLDMTLGLADRVFRAASGVAVKVKIASER